MKRNVADARYCSMRGRMTNREGERAQWVNRDRAIARSPRPFPGASAVRMKEEIELSRMDGRQQPKDVVCAPNAAVHAAFRALRTS